MQNLIPKVYCYINNFNLTDLSKLSNNINSPTDFQTPSNNIFIDPKQSLNIDDLFFLKSFTGG